MTYDCFCDDYDCEFYHKEIRKARKPHKCVECSGIISIKEHYEHVIGKWDGYVGSFNTCIRCVDLRTWVKNNVPCLCIVHWNQDEENQNAIDAAYLRANDEVKGLRFGYLRRKTMRNKFNFNKRRESKMLESEQEK